MKNGFVAQFIPTAVGLHVVLVEYNGVAVGGTPYYAKVISEASVGEEFPSTQRSVTSPPTTEVIEVKAPISTQRPGV